MGPGGEAGDTRLVICAFGAMPREVGQDLASLPGALTPELPYGLMHQRGMRAHGVVGGVIDAHHADVGAYTEQDLQEEPPQGRAAHPGFWQRVQQSGQRQSVQTSTGMPSASPRTRHPMETPAELLARIYPTLYMRAFAGI
jgi:hypothetical protein